MADTEITVQLKKKNYLSSKRPYRYITKYNAEIGTHSLTRKTFHFGASSKTSSKKMETLVFIDEAPPTSVCAQKNNSLCK